MFSKSYIFDTDGNEVDNKVNMFGKVIRYYLKHSNFFLFIDKVGSNLYCNNDKNITSKKYIKYRSSNYTNIYSNNNKY